MQLQRTGRGGRSKISPQKTLGSFVARGGNRDGEFIARGGERHTGINCKIMAEESNCRNQGDEVAGSHGGGVDNHSGIIGSYLHARTNKHRDNTEYRSQYRE